MLATVAIGLGGALLMLSRSQSPAQEPRPAPAGAAAPLTEIKVIERVTHATDRALDYLASKQNRDGSWHRNHAVNALALLAFLGRGHVPGRGPYRDVLEKGKKFLLESTAKARPKGYLSFGTMYEHGLATLALAEMYGQDPDPELEERLRDAVDLICHVQSNGGGWNYSPAKGEGDLSVTVMQIVALRAADNAKIPVPRAVIDKAIGYVHRHASPAGGFGYTGPGQGPQTTAAGILSLQLLGEYNDPTIAKSLKVLTQVPIHWGPIQNGPQYFYYFHYYAIQALYQTGGKEWNEWHPRIRELLLEKQNPDGSWNGPPGTAEIEGTVGPNKIYWTAMASLVLDIYMHFLPAYQR
jgi:hypothetical protein